MNILWLLCSPCPSLKLSFFLIYKREELMLLNCGVGENSWESLGLQGDQPVHPIGDQSWVFIGGTDVEAETPYFGHLMQRADSLGKTLMLGKMRAGGEGDNRGWDGWMASLTQWTWIGWTPGVGDGQGGLACCVSWGRKELDMTERLHFLLNESLVLGIFYMHSTTVCGAQKVLFSVNQKLQNNTLHQ